MEEFRALQAEEKKLFLANLGEAEKKLKDKERQADEVRCNDRSVSNSLSAALCVSLVLACAGVGAVDGEAGRGEGCSIARSFSTSVALLGVFLRSSPRPVVLGGENGTELPLD